MKRDQRPFVSMAPRADLPSTSNFNEVRQNCQLNAPIEAQRVFPAPSTRAAPTARAFHGATIRARHRRQSFPVLIERRDGGAGSRLARAGVAPANRAAPTTAGR